MFQPVQQSHIVYLHVFTRPYSKLVPLPNRRGDLTDRMKVMNVEDDKRKRTALREARIAFLEEEMPALVAGGADFETVKCVVC